MESDKGIKKCNNIPSSCTVIGCVSWLFSLEKTFWLKWVLLNVDLLGFSNGLANETGTTAGIG